MIPFTAAMFVFAFLFFAALYEPRTRPARPSFQPTCPCGCGRPPGQHNEPVARRALPPAPGPVIFIPGQREPS
jgi:hypothetical protein